MIQRLDAPYNFVPISGHVYEPNWAGRVSHDMPLEDGLSGRIRYRLTTHTPLLVGGAHRTADKNQPGRVEFFKLPDGQPAIPGSSLRGMIRNVLEIAGFGKMQAIDDRRFGLRDLTGAAKEDYTGRMVGKSQAGWLFFDMDSKRWRIRPCGYARIAYERIAKLARQPVNKFTAPAAKTAMQKYDAWKRSSPRHGLQVEVVVAAGEDRFVPRECYLQNERAGEKAARGKLVFTGQLPVRNRRAQKKREFVFLDGPSEPFDVPHEVMQGFIDIHETFQESDEWIYWRGRHFKDREQIPVFYLWEGDQIASLGLAMMFKVAPPFSTHAMRGHTAKLDGIDGDDPHGRETLLDLTDLIFGCVHDDDSDGLRARVSIGTARLTNPDNIQLRDHGPSVLGSPKPSYFPTYLRQPIDLSQPWRLAQGQPYRTYFDEEAELAGWKRYPVHAPGKKSLPPLNDANRNNRKVQIELQTIEAPEGVGAVFEGWLRFHNMTRTELGAVFWAMTFGGSADHRHALGMAKAYGFGQVSVEILDDEHQLEIDANDGGEVDRSTIVKECIEAFVDDMEAFASERKQAFPEGWMKSLQLQRLLAMADPTMGDQWPSTLRHITLDPQNRVNDFVDAKKARIALAPYGDIALERDRRPIGKKSRPPSPAATATRPAPEALAPPAPAAADPNLLYPKGTKVDYAGEPGRLAEPLRRGMREIGVDFDGEVEPVSVDELELP